MASDPPPKTDPQQQQTSPSPTSPPTTSPSPTPEKPSQTTTTSNGQLPLHNTDIPLTRELTPTEKIKRTLAVRPTGESGRSGIHPLIFLRNVFRSASWASRIVNVLWPVVPAAIAVRYAMPDNSLVIFILSYLAMVPCANLIGYAGQELSRKFPHVLGVIIETT
jgi:Ca2+:H+ antiporter